MARGDAALPRQICRLLRTRTTLRVLVVLPDGDGRLHHRQPDQRNPRHAGHPWFAPSQPCRERPQVARHWQVWLVAIDGPRSHRRPHPAHRLAGVSGYSPSQRLWPADDRLGSYADRAGFAPRCPSAVPHPLRGSIYGWLRLDPVPVSMAMFGTNQGRERGRARACSRELDVVLPVTVRTGSRDRTPPQTPITRQPYRQHGAGPPTVPARQPLDRRRTRD